MEVDSMPEKGTTNESITKYSSLPVEKSIEGYVIIALNIHEEATEEDVFDFFEDYGRVKNLHLNLDRQTGYVKGYALVEYATLEEAQQAVTGSNGVDLLGRNLTVDFAFTCTDADASHISDTGLTSRSRGARNESRGGRNRSKSPGSRHRDPGQY